MAIASRRDSNRTKGRYLAILAQREKAAGKTEAEFVGHFLPRYQDIARKAYQEARP